MDQRLWPADHLESYIKKIEISSAASDVSGVDKLLRFGVRGKNARTLAPGRTQVNLLGNRKREHSRKPDEQYDIIEACSPGPFVELFARGTRKGWATWGNQADESYKPTWKTYAHHSRAGMAIEAAE